MLTTTLAPVLQRFNHTNHDFEITLENATTIEHVQEQAAEIPQVQYSVSSPAVCLLGETTRLQALL